MSIFNIDKIELFFINLGTPLIALYHLVIGSTFLNVAADDAQGLEKIANYALAPMHFLLEGKKAIPQTETTYQFQRRFEYNENFLIKSSVSITALPFCLAVGIPLKALSYLSPTTQKRYQDIASSLEAIKVVSNLDTYRAFGLNIGEWEKAEMIEKPKHQRRPQDEDILKDEVGRFVKIIEIFKKHKIPFWLDCGTCLGAYRYGGAIPWDLDIDIAALKPDFKNIYSALHELNPAEFAVFDFSGRDKPETYIRVLAKKTNFLFDIYLFDIEPEKKIVHTILSNEFNMFLRESWKAKELKFTKPMPFERVFPLKKTLFEGIEVPIPNKIEEYLQTYYGENLAPVKIYNEQTGQYEKDLSHPYWKLPGVY